MTKSELIETIARRGRPLEAPPELDRQVGSVVLESPQLQTFERSPRLSYLYSSLKGALFRVRRIKLHQGADCHTSRKAGHHPRNAAKVLLSKG